MWPGVCTTRTSLDICHAPPASSFTSQSFAASTASARWMTRCNAGKRAFQRSWSGQLSRCVMMSFSTPPSSSMVVAKRLLYRGTSIMMLAGRSCPVALSGTVRLMRYGVAPYDAAKEAQQKCHVRKRRNGVVHGSEHVPAEW